VNEVNRKAKGKRKMTKTETTKPVLEHRFNHIKLAVWANVNKGQTWHNVVVTRRFREGDEWKESSSFSGLGDLALVSAAVKLAEEYLRAKALENQSQGDDADAIGGL
jgi:hypothetical protein